MNGNLFNVQKRVNINLNDYKNAHADLECDGKWGVLVQANAFYTESCLGPIKLPAIAYVQCQKCKATYMAPEFRDLIEETIVRHLVFQQNTLAKKQIKFLRQYFDLTQEDLARKLGIADKHEISKMESENAQTKVMSTDSQIRFKIKCAEWLGVKDIDSIFKINDDVKEDGVVAIKPSWFPDKETVEKVLKRA
jgi:DNA-binding XRE family transcriptional regulator